MLGGGGGELPDPRAITAEKPFCHLSSQQLQPLIVPDSLEKGGKYLQYLSIFLFILSLCSFN